MITNLYSVKANFLKSVNYSLLKYIPNLLYLSISVFCFRVKDNLPKVIVDIYANIIDTIISGII